ncbi:MAG: hypothetical protein ACE5JF_07890 [Anaerolineales bacterium]
MLLLAASLVVAGLACQVNVGGPEPPAEIIEASEASATELANNWESILSLDTGEVKLVITERQLTSFLSERFESDEEPILRRPQVFLRDSEIKIYGTAGAGVFEAGALLSIQPTVSSDGDVEFEITTAEFGPVPAPGALTTVLSELLTEAFTGTLGSMATGIRITSLAIADGQVVIVGSPR